MYRTVASHRASRPSARRGVVGRQSSVNKQRSVDLKSKRQWTIGSNGSNDKSTQGHARQSTERLFFTFLKELDLSYSGRNLADVALNERMTLDPRDVQLYIVLAARYVPCDFGTYKVMRAILMSRHGSRCQPGFRLSHRYANVCPVPLCSISEAMGSHLTSL